MREEEIEEIEQIFEVKFIGESRIDGYPIFKCKYMEMSMIEVFNYFKISYVPLLEDQMPGFPAGEKSTLLFKITEIRPDFYKLLRKKKLQKIEICL